MAGGQAPMGGVAILGTIMRRKSSRSEVCMVTLRCEAGDLASPRSASVSAARPHAIDLTLGTIASPIYIQMALTTHVRRHTLPPTGVRGL